MNNKKLLFSLLSCFFLPLRIVAQLALSDSTFFPLKRELTTLGKSIDSRQILNSLQETKRFFNTKNVYNLNPISHFYRNKKKLVLSANDLLLKDTAKIAQYEYYDFPYPPYKEELKIELHTSYDDMLKQHPFAGHSIFVKNSNIIFPENLETGDYEWKHYINDLKTLNKETQYDFNLTNSNRPIDGIALSFNSNYTLRALSTTLAKSYNSFIDSLEFSSFKEDPLSSDSFFLKEITLIDNNKQNFKFLFSAKGREKPFYLKYDVRYIQSFFNQNEILKSIVILGEIEEKPSPYEKYERVVPLIIKTNRKSYIIVDNYSFEGIWATTKPSHSGLQSFEEYIDFSVSKSAKFDFEIPGKEIFIKKNLEKNKIEQIVRKVLIMYSEKLTAPPFQGYLTRKFDDEIILSAEQQRNNGLYDGKYETSFTYLRVQLNNSYKEDQYKLSLFFDYNGFVQQAVTNPLYQLTPSEAAKYNTAVSTMFKLVYEDLKNKFLTTNSSDGIVLNDIRK